MKLVKQSVEIVDEIDGVFILKKLERIGRICYNSESKITDDSYKTFISNILLRGHESVLEHFNITIKWITDRGCYDIETQVLTENGFKFFKDVKENELIYTLDDNNNLVLSSIKRKIEYNYNGEMYGFRNTKFDLLVTPDHNMWVKDENKRSKESKIWKFIKADKMNNGRYSFYKSSNYAGNLINEITIPSIDIMHGFYKQNYPELKMNAKYFLKLLGIWITDGSISYGKNGNGNRITITQVKVNVKGIIEKLLKKLDLKYSFYKNDYRIHCPQLFMFLENNFIQNKDCKKTYYISIPKWIKNLDKSSLQQVFEGIVLGDGHVRKTGKGTYIYTASLEFAHDLVEIALKLGKSANIYEKGRIGNISNKKMNIIQKVKLYSVNIIESPTTLYNKNKTHFGKSNYYKCNYNGKVYCLELEKYHRLYVLRNGKGIWSGNCMAELTRHRIASFSIQSTRYCNYSNKDMEFISPVDFQLNELQLQFLRKCEIEYNEAINRFKLSPQQARYFLPNGLKTEIIFTMNLRELRHMLDLRCNSSAHPQIKSIAKETLCLLYNKIPIIFDDLYGKYFVKEIKNES